MTHPQSPASPLPEAAEPVAWQFRDRAAEPWCWINCNRETFEQCGAKPEFYETRPLYAAPSPVAQAPAQAGEVARLVEEAKREADAIRGDFESSAKLYLLIDRLAALATQPLAAPVQQEAEAGEVMVPVPAETLSRWRKWCLGYEWPKVQDWDSHDVFLAIADEIRTKYEQPLATPPAQPVLAPVVREPLSIEQILRIADEADLARDYNGDGDVQSTRREDADITEDVVNFARAIERHFGIQATTGEQSHG